MSDIIKADFSAAIAEGFTSLTDMLARIDAYHIRGRLTDEEKDTLYAEARAAAPDNFAEHLEIFETLTAFGKRISDLEAAVAALQGGGSGGGENMPPEFVSGKWYYNGDRITFNGIAYTCSAPDGVVVVWSPADTPQYWTADEE